MTSTQKITVWKVEDHEGNGECQECHKTGLRWVTILSDGSKVGGECAKKILGWAPTAAKFSWVTGLSSVEEATVSGERVVLWASEDGTRGAVSVDGRGQVMGPFDYCEQMYRERYAV